MNVTLAFLPLYNNCGLVSGPWLILEHTSSNLCPAVFASSKKNQAERRPYESADIFFSLLKTYFPVSWWRDCSTLASSAHSSRPYHGSVWLFVPLVLRQILGFFGRTSICACHINAWWLFVWFKYWQFVVVVRIDNVYYKKKEKSKQDYRTKSSIS